VWENCIQGFDGKAGEKRSLVRTRKRWKHNIKIDLQEIRFEGMDFIDVA
jgi:hypothetical protein